MVTNPFLAILNTTRKPRLALDVCVLGESYGGYLSTRGTTWSLDNDPPTT